ncbi:MAG: FGGY family carbohydrate kinase, partial [Clostridia bacterium]|nr:FGGY family carbohydrate kinase [Clostridia bacterium]
MAYIGIDIGTTGCKCMAFNADMEVLSESYFEYPLLYGKNGEVEQDPDEWWAAARAGLSKVSSGLKDIKAIGVSSQGITVVPVDIEGKKLCNALTWLDMRASFECEALENKLGSSKIGKITGKRINPAYTLPKLMWIKAKRPEIYEKTHKFLLAHDYVINKLCGEFVTEDSLAAGTMAYDISTKNWDEGVIGIAGISMEKLPFIANSGSPIGKVNGKISEELGISGNIVISAGGQDQKCAAFG